MTDTINNPQNERIVIPEKLTIKQKLWIQHFLGDCNQNATEAAARAGYGGNRQTLTAIGTENRNNPAIRKVIEQWMRRHVTPQDVIERLCQIATIDVKDFFTINKKTKEAELDLARAFKENRTAGIKSIKVTKYPDGRQQTSIECHDAMPALIALGKHFGLFERQTSAKAQLEYLLGALPDELRDGILQSLDLVDGSGRRASAIGEGSEFVEAEPDEITVSDSVLE